MYICPMDPDIISEKPGKCPKCGMRLNPMGDNTANKTHMGQISMEDDFKKRFFITLPFVLLTILLSPNIQKWFHFNLHFTGSILVLFLLGTFIFFYGGIPFFKSAKSEITSKNPGMMTLVALAIIVGYVFSVAATFIFPGDLLYWEISTLISVFLLGHYLEMRAVRGATGALSALSKLIPKVSHLIKDKKIIDIETSQIKLNDVVLVKPGEKIPSDGEVIDGSSLVNEAMITGESRLISKKKGSLVIGGTINQDGALTIKITKTGTDTVISQIMKLITDAQSSKPKVQYLADKAANWLTFIAIFASILSFIFWFFISPHGAVFALTLAVSTIVVACPHALGLAIPTVTTITSSLGAKNGILIKDMKSLENARKINYVVFDKTGTLTKGEMGIADIVLNKNVKVTKQKLIAFVSAIEAKSQHSLALGILDFAKKRNIEILDVKNFISYAGKGAEGIVDGKKILIGNKILFKEMKIDVKELVKILNKTAVYVAFDNKFVGEILLTDVIRDESKKAVERLHTIGIKVAMLTGDNKGIADEVGKELNIDTVFSEVLPKDKVSKIKELQSKGNIVAMVGDGVNDSPSLVQANVGIAIGAGTDVAVESAGIVLMKNDPLDVLKIISLSRKNHKKMLQNLFWAAGYNIFAIPLAGGILYSSFGILLRPEWSALLMSLSSIIVVFNALLLGKSKL